MSAGIMGGEDVKRTREWCDAHPHTITRLTWLLVAVLLLQVATLLLIGALHV